MVDSLVFGINMLLLRKHYKFTSLILLALMLVTIAHMQVNVLKELDCFISSFNNLKIKSAQPSSHEVSKQIYEFTVKAIMKFAFRQ